MPVTDLPAPSSVAAPAPEDETETNSAFSTEIRLGAEQFAPAFKPAEGESWRHIFDPSRSGALPTSKLPAGSRTSTASGFSFRAASIKACAASTVPAGRETRCISSFGPVIKGASGEVKNCSAEWAGNRVQKERARTTKEAEREEVSLSDCKGQDLNISNLETDSIVKTSRI